MKSSSVKIRVGDLVRDKYMGDRFGIVLEVVKKNRLKVRLFNGVILLLYREDLEVVSV